MEEGCGFAAEPRMEISKAGHFRENKTNGIQREQILYGYRLYHHLQIPTLRTSERLYSYGGFATEVS